MIISRQNLSRLGGFISFCLRGFCIDVIIEGVSLAKVQREEFNSIIQNNDGNIEVLLKNLNDFVFND